jgi:hypothetical protein
MVRPNAKQFGIGTIFGRTALHVKCLFPTRSDSPTAREKYKQLCLNVSFDIKKTIQRTYMYIGMRHFSS